jgi:hypothetical protein
MAASWIRVGFKYMYLPKPPRFVTSHIYGLRTSIQLAENSTQKVNLH